MIVKYTFEILKAAKMFDFIYKKDESEIDKCWERYIDNLSYWLDAFIDYTNRFEKDVQDDTRDQFITKISKKLEIVQNINDHDQRMQFIKENYDKKNDEFDYFSEDVYIFRSYWSNKVSNEADKILYNKDLTSIDKVYKLGRLYRNEGKLDDSMYDLWCAILEMKDEHISEVRQEEEPEYFDTFKKSDPFKEAYKKQLEERGE